ncbi:85/88 kDa calcium-independent phospholipase A2-like [Phoenix dactylifera]|uniref:85/88 kDa calcium-independent phospholipase A2-like n=1 Tax=Phoenix dactylifera TaxID=42345 RepID=A0A8B9A6D1_PHODC|nr:85/88 kDa calcium-independent phospholipase A2-like [Phoenix dactylifera]
MSSPHFDIHPQAEDEKTQDVPDAVKEDLFRKAMQSRWQDVARSYSENEKVRETQITWAGDTLLHLAVSSGKESNVKLLVGCLEKSVLDKRRQEILAIQNDRGDTALHIAAALGMVGVCLAMARLHPKMVVEIYNRWQETPLFKAVRHGQKEVFFALQSVVEEKLNIKPTPGVRRVRGDTILHEAIFAERFDLALEIIKRYPDLVDYVNEKGESPLHVLANKPSVFKSGTRFSLLESVICHGIFVDQLKVEYLSYKKKFRKNEGIDFEKVSHDGNDKLPDNYKAYYNIFTLLKHAFKNIAPWTSSEDDKSKHITDVENEISAPWTDDDDDKPKHSIDVEISGPWTSGEDGKSKHITDVEIQMPEKELRSCRTS